MQSPHQAETLAELQPDHDPRLVEAWIRTIHPTLDGVSWNELERCARQAAACIDADPNLSERLARTFGL